MYFKKFITIILILNFTNLFAIQIPQTQNVLALPQFSRNFEIIQIPNNSYLIKINGANTRYIYIDENKNQVDLFKVDGKWQVKVNSRTCEFNTKFFNQFGIKKFLEEEDDQTLLKLLQEGYELKVEANGVYLQAMGLQGGVKPENIEDLEREKNIEKLKNIVIKGRNKKRRIQAIQALGRLGEIDFLRGINYQDAEINKAAEVATEAIGKKEKTIEPKVEPKVEKKPEVKLKKTEPTKWLIEHEQINVGQGDCALVLLKKWDDEIENYVIVKAILIDAGGEAKRGSPTKATDDVKKILTARLAGKKLDAVIISHWDTDHWNIVEKLKEFIEEGNTQFFSPITGINKSLLSLFCKDKNFLTQEDLIEAKEKNKNIHLGSDILKTSLWDYLFEEEEKKELESQEVRFDFLAVDREEKSNNASSISCLIEHKGTTLLTQGDIEEQEELVRAEKVNIFKANHHGSNENFSRKRGQEITFMSFGRDNPYSHPGFDATKHFLETSIDVFGTNDPSSLSAKLAIEVKKFWEEWYEKIKESVKKSKKTLKGHKGKILEKLEELNAKESITLDDLKGFKKFVEQKIPKLHKGTNLAKFLKAIEELSKEKDETFIETFKKKFIIILESIKTKLMQNGEYDISFKEDTAYTQRKKYRSYTKKELTAIDRLNGKNGFAIRGEGNTRTLYYGGTKSRPDISEKSKIATITYTYDEKHNKIIIHFRLYDENLKAILAANRAVFGIKKKAVAFYETLYDFGIKPRDLENIDGLDRIHIQAMFKIKKAQRTLKLKILTAFRGLDATTKFLQNITNPISLPIEISFIPETWHLIVKDTEEAEKKISGDKMHIWLEKKDGVITLNITKKMAIILSLVEETFLQNIFFHEQKELELGSHELALVFTDEKIKKFILNIPYLELFLDIISAPASSFTDFLKKFTEFYNNLNREKIELNILTNKQILLSA